MELTHLEVVGFKSFYHKTELTFGSGITAIIGPNGCGKSNVSEAIRWVLGEQNARGLRCEKMEDVIFVGTKERAATGMAEVSITFTNSRGVLPLEYTDVTLTRRLFRSGDSEYLINRKQCRLKDIVDLFLDTGMGTNAYSLLERSMVDSILSDRTEDRRFLFDEAAGIMKYKARRKSTLKKLAATETDLIRLEDIVTEVDKQVNSLKRQVKRAEMYQQYSNDLLAVETALAYAKFHQLLAEEKPLLRQQQDLGDKISGFGVAIESREAEIETLRQQMLGQEENATKARQVLAQMAQETRKLDEELLVNRERQKSLETQITRFDQEREGLKSKVERLKKDSVETERGIAATQEKIGQLQKQFQHIKVERDRATEDTKVHEKQIITIEEKTREILRQRLGLENDLKNFKQRAQDLTVQLQQGERQLASMAEERQTRQKELTQLTKDFEEVNKTAQRLTDQIKSRTTEMERKQAQRNELARQEQQDREQAASVKSNLKVLEDLQNRFEGFQKGVRQLMTRPSTGSGRGLDGLAGVLADYVSTKPEFETAIEAALGQKVQVIIADKPETILAGIEALQKDKAGQAGFYATDSPLEKGAGVANFSLQVRSDSSPTEVRDSDILREAGVRGVAADLIEAKGPAGDLARILLAQTVIVDDLATAMRINKNYPQWDLATLNGETVERTGIITGGHGQQGKDSSLLARKRQIASLSKEAEALQIRLSELGQKRSRLEAELNELNQQQKDDQETLNRQRQKATTMERQIQALTFQVGSLDQRQEELSVTVDKQRNEQKLTGEKIRQVDLAFQQAAKESQQAEEALKTARETLQGVRQKAGQLASQLNKAQIDLISAEGQLEKLQSDLSRIAEARQDAEKIIVRHEQEGAEARRQIEVLKSRNGVLAISLEERHRKEEDQRKLADELHSVVQTVTNQVQDIEKVIRHVRKEREDAQLKEHEIELRLAHLQQERQNIKARLLEEYQADVEAITEAPAAVKDWQTDGGLNVHKGEETALDLRQRLKGLGPVNLMALEEYKTEADRFEFLTTQKKDLEEAKTSLQKALREINKEARERFRTTYEQIRLNFINMFVTLFEGGEADLKIEENVDLLEASIDIIARPKGKKPQSITLLSAGERALTAIALLFAIYLVKPSPFCILDEIDAPLDDANIGRFTKILRELTRHSQFVMITHNKRTMEIADRLYGVTMEEPGVSRLVSVKFEEREMEKG